MEFPGGLPELPSNIYPFYSYYNPSFYPYSSDGGNIPSEGEPLTIIPDSNRIQAVSTHCPSFKEAKDILGSKVANVSRKEKRKMIKNKRRRLQRKEMSYLLQEQKCDVSYPYTSIIYRMYLKMRMRQMGKRWTK